MFMKEFMIPFATGLTIFLFGMQIMRIGFENLFLEKIKSLLTILTHHPVMGFLTGVISTAILQSSSAVTLLTIAFTHSKILSLRQALGIILGTNIGTTFTTELIAFKVEHLGVYLFFLGFVFFLFPNIKVKSSGFVLGGFGLLFIGMEMMQSIAPVIKSFGWLDHLYVFGQEGVISGILAGTFLTALIQSSTATTAITMNLIYDQLLPLSIAIAIILGSNIGTCITALLGSIGTNRAAKQVALSHVILNLGGVLLFIPLIPLLQLLVEWMSSSPTQQVAHAQLIFNVLCSLVVLPFIRQFEAFIIFLSPKQK
ncbi:Na/Pi cotransporter family protein [Caldalkalibacillus mannanilyticus]|uniref:Na/Pi cotransporter family protein n=1 Tax=Caldalkalibacillus mannanilyticus TaxID=1418 RepID=UPI000AAEF41F|nr:Na/Pi symporter [Caldalkalibacillus mannanilyticus]